MYIDYSKLPFFMLHLSQLTGANRDPSQPRSCGCPCCASSLVVNLACGNSKVNPNIRFYPTVRRASAVAPVFDQGEVEHHAAEQREYAGLSRACWGARRG